MDPHLVRHSALVSIVLALASLGACRSRTRGSNVRGPCDIYRDAGQPCVAAYSTVRRLLSTYAGPLYRSGAGARTRTPARVARRTTSGRPLMDSRTRRGWIPHVRARCAPSHCSRPVWEGKPSRVRGGGCSVPGSYAALDDFESSATGESLMVGGHRVYSLYMEPRQGYRLPRLGDGIPRGLEPQGIYMLQMARVRALAVAGTSAAAAQRDFVRRGERPILRQRRHEPQHRRHGRRRRRRSLVHVGQRRARLGGRLN